MDRQGTKNLVAAIILMALKDRRKAQEKLLKSPEDKEALEVEKDTREFFESTWYQELRDYEACNLPSDMLEVI